MAGEAMGGGGMTTPAAPVLAAIEKAEQEVFDLCSGKHRWTMRVPAEPDRDSDLVIGGALRMAADYIKSLGEPTE
jgi:hypothetical protein